MQASKDGCALIERKSGMKLRKRNICTRHLETFGDGTDGDEAVRDQALEERGGGGVE